jgi:hypothetical protein
VVSSRHRFVVRTSHALILTKTGRAHPTRDTSGKHRERAFEEPTMAWRTAVIASLALLVVGVAAQGTNYKCR